MTKGKTSHLSRFLLFLLRRLGSYRAWRLLHELRQADPAWMRGLLEYVLKNELPDRVLGPGFLRYYMRDPGSIPQAVVPSVLDENLDHDVARQLDEIPSETTPGERRFLYQFFKMMWTGKNVLEIGPFLGGTTRAMALGMRANPLRDRAAALYTYDRFQVYYAEDELVGFLQPLFEKGLLKEEDRASLGPSSSFKDVFTRIHQGRSYSGLIKAIDRPLPERAGEVRAQGEWFAPEAGIELDAVFVDGCKAWYATKYFMKKVCQHTQPGTVFIFQDYLQYTCFWLPAMMEVLHPCFSLMAYVDQTYAFQQHAELTPDMIDARYPDIPEELGRKGLDDLFTTLIARSRARGDMDAWVKQSMQHAGALAYIGDKDAARRQLQVLAGDPDLGGYSRGIAEALRSPTYRPNGAAGEPVCL